MQIILTEQQITFIKDFTILSESLINETDFTQVKKFVIKALLSGMAASSIIAAISNANISKIEKNELIELIHNDSMNETDLAKKIEAAKECMLYYTQLNGYDLGSTPLSPEALVRACEKHNFDIPLALAQAKVESIFGNTPRAQKTKSVWSVGSWDNGKNLNIYNNANDSIEPYINIMQRDYLRGKSIDDMLRPGQMVNHLGQRYASDRNYEKTVRAVRNAIISRYPILAL